MDSETQIRLFDPRRNPRDWTDLIRPTQCAVFLKDRHTSMALAGDGRPYKNVTDTECIIFDHLASAQQFCEARVQALPDLCCEIYDSEGLAHPPLLVILHPAVQRKEESSAFSSQQRRLLAAGLCLTSAPLFWVAMRHPNPDLFMFLAFSCILLALRFVYWDFGLKHRENERLKRLEAHRKRESGEA